MGEMNEVKGLLILAGIGVKSSGLGGREKNERREAAKILHPIKIKKAW